VPKTVGDATAPGSFRNHNRQVSSGSGQTRLRYPVATEYTENLRPLLDKFGNDKRLRLILFTLDESTYSRELAPLAGHYPALRLGPPGGSRQHPGMTRFRLSATETAGIYNTAGFNDDTRRSHRFVRGTICPARGRKLPGSTGVPSRGRSGEAEQMAVDLAYNLVRQSYRLEQG